MNVKKMNITPDLAKSMLEKNIGNRPMVRNHVLTLAREMQNGRWKVNGDTLCINKERLIDGQHRLAAVIESGVTIETLVVSDLDSDVFDTKDVGKRRSAGDTLASKGEMNTKNLAATLSVIERYMSGKIDKTMRYTTTEIEEFLVKYPGARWSVKLVGAAKRLMPPSLMSAAHYLFSQKNKKEADEFTHMLLDGVGYEEGDPIHALRERLFRNNMSTAKVSNLYLLAITIKAWNAKRDGRSLRKIRFCEDGDGKEAFPVVK